MVTSTSQKSLLGNTKTPPDLDEALLEGLSRFTLVHIIGNEANTLLKVTTNNMTRALCFTLNYHYLIFFLDLELYNHKSIPIPSYDL
jgi:hypothetical protein